MTAPPCSSLFETLQASASMHHAFRMADHPFIGTLLSDQWTPIQLFAQLQSQLPHGKHKHAVLLESTEGDTRLARYSMIGYAPSFTLTCHEGISQLRCTQTDACFYETKGNSLTLMQGVLEHLFTPSHQALCHGLEGFSHLPFVGGWMGYIGYGLTYQLDGIVPQGKKLPALADIPELTMGFYKTFLVFDHLYRRLHFVSWEPTEDAENAWKSLQATLHHSSGRLSPLVLPDSWLKHTLSQSGLDPSVQPAVAPLAFQDAVKACKKLITQGEVFQIVLANAFVRKCHHDPLTIYRYVQALNPSPYGYYVQFPEGVYLGASPETFVECGLRQQDASLSSGSSSVGSREYYIKVKSLAGTRPRGKTPEEDKLLAKELQADPKERAEHAMLVDLSRNDLGRVCQIGSVKTGTIAEVLYYTHVMHLGTDIEGILSEDKTVFDALASCFPRDTVTGAPKIRAMEHLSQLEPYQRGIYSGMVGTLDARYTLNSAIAIRSLTLNTRHEAVVQAGAGIVHDSIPEMEFLETCNKARSILKAIDITEALTPPDDAS
ncbi:MAG: anthranilate synthase component I family protein [Vampirovibrionales bacterium]